MDEVPIEITPEYSSMEDEKLSVLEESQSGTENRDSKKNIFYLIIDILIGLIVLALLITAYASVKNRKRRRKRKNRGRKS